MVMVMATQEDTLVFLFSFFLFLVLFSFLSSGKTKKHVEAYYEMTLIPTERKDEKRKTGKYDGVFHPLHNMAALSKVKKEEQVFPPTFGSVEQTRNRGPKAPCSLAFPYFFWLLLLLLLLLFFALSFSLIIVCMKVTTKIEKPFPCSFCFLSFSFLGNVHLHDDDASPESSPAAE